jgi:hypothetical protein
MLASENHEYSTQSLSLALYIYADNMVMYDPAQLCQGYEDHEALREDQYACQGTTVSMYMSYEKVFAAAGAGKLSTVAFALHSGSCPARQISYAQRWHGMPRGAREGST